MIDLSKRLSKGAQQLMIRLAAFSVIFFSEVFLVKMSVDFGLAAVDLVKKFHIPQDLPTFMMMGVIAFALVAKDKMKKMRRIEAFDIPMFSVLFSINIIAFVGFVLLNRNMIANSEAVAASPMGYLALWYFLAISLTISLFMAFFKPVTLKNLFKKFKYESITAVVLAGAFMKIYPLLYKLWPKLSFVVGESAAIMLRVVIPEARFQMVQGMPRLSTPNFKAIIAASCSGIEGIMLFLVLFTVFILFYRSQLNMKKVAVLYVIGVIGIFIMNIFRVALLFFVGSKFSVEFAAGMFHTNLGWIMYSVYFAGFEIFFYDWLKKDKKLFGLFG